MELKMLTTKHIFNDIKYFKFISKISMTLVITHRIAQIVYQLIKLIG